MKHLFIQLIISIFLLLPKVSFSQHNGLTINLLNLKAFNYNTNEQNSISSSEGKSINVPLQIGYRRYFKNDLVIETRIGHTSINDNREDVIMVNDSSETTSKFRFKQKLITLHINISENFKYKSLQFQLGFNFPIQYGFSFSNSVNNFESVNGKLVRNSEQKLTGTDNLILGIRTNLLVEKKITKGLFLGASLHLGFLKEYKFGTSINETNFFENNQNIYSNKVITNYKTFTITNFDVSPSFSLSYLF